MNSDLDYVGHLARESARFAEVLAEVPPDARVPSCPDWNADDLLWHLAEVQWFWGTIVRERVNRERAEQLKPPRPADRAGLWDFYDRARHDLAEVLAATPPDEAAWTWSDDHTVGFIRRRQAHEALIHRVDAELTAGDRTPLDPVLSADGVDEALRVIYGGLPGWATFTPDAAQTVRLRATDTGDTWLVTLGQFRGTDPGDGTAYDEPDAHPADRDPGTDAAAEVTGTAADLDCWLWHRPPLTPVETSGDRQVLSRYESAIGPGIN
ncbi:MAG TPA: maleylpyruvate isomerase family mycothiol-dependent enzyme [Streptosporangiaceae bacterium]|nr:maleylpyruvate isomerase family mycothiol-dependent enzyme [Streptosporangiaceae bacterium]